MTAEQESVVERVRTWLADEPTTREVRMFGGTSFLVNEKMVVAVRGNGALLVRVDPARQAELMVRPGTERVEMGRGRLMGPGWIGVAPEAVSTSDRLSFWLGEALGYNATARRTKQ